MVSFFATPDRSNQIVSSIIPQHWLNIVLSSTIICAASLDTFYSPAHLLCKCLLIPSILKDQKGTLQNLSAVLQTHLLLHLFVAITPVHSTCLVCCVLPTFFSEYCSSRTSTVRSCWVGMPLLSSPAWVPCSAIPTSSPTSWTMQSSYCNDFPGASRLPILTMKRRTLFRRGMEFIPNRTDVTSAA